MKEIAQLPGYTVQSSIEKKDERKCLEKIKSRHTEELVFALCGPLGSGVSEVAKMLQAVLKLYDYEVDYIKVSDLIKKYAISDLKIDNTDHYNRIKSLQKEGNLLREKFGKDILSQYIIREIGFKRQRDNENSGITETTSSANSSRRYATIIDSLKHPAEVNFLETIYSKMFYFIGVLCPEDIRIKRLQESKYLAKNEASELVEIDRKEHNKAGQQLIDTLYHADFFVRNISDDKDSMKTPLQRYVELVLGEIKYTPTISEYAMFIAQSAALRSGCLSRQVGAAIVNQSGDIVATGRNDVPKFGGGLYNCDDKNEMRCMKRRKHTCSNDEYRKDLTKYIKELLMGEGIGLKEEIADTIVEKVSDSNKIKSIVEFSRSIHAEMDAITSVARRGHVSLQGCTLYCTTFPCHNCARHIVASGIREVYYIEPYEKSKAYDLHDDSIVLETQFMNEEISKLKIFPFEGVAPKQYMSLFKINERKKDGVMIEKNLKKSLPIIAQFIDSYIDYEQKVIEHLKIQEATKAY